MRSRYDFSKATRGPVVGGTVGKTRITIRIDDDVLEWFRGQVHAAGGGSYQKLMNTALRRHVELQAQHGTRVREELAETLRTVIREELSMYVVAAEDDPGKA